MIKEQNLEGKYLNLQKYTVKQKILSLTKGKKVALAGAVVHTYRLLELLNEEIEICCIAAKDHKYSFDGIIQTDYCGLPEFNVDVIIISSYIYRNEIRMELQKLPLHAEILDLYMELEKCGLPLNKEIRLL